MSEVAKPPKVDSLYTVTADKLKHNVGQCVRRKKLRTRRRGGMLKWMRKLKRDELDLAELISSDQETVELMVDESYATVIGHAPRACSGFENRSGSAGWFTIIWGGPQSQMDVKRRKIAVAKMKKEHLKKRNLVCNHTEGPYHDCGYVDHRNKIVNQAYAIANSMVVDDERLNFNKVYHAKVKELYDENPYRERSAS